MNLKVRKSLAPAAAVALTCSLVLAANPASAATVDNDTNIDTGASLSLSGGTYQGRIAGIDRFGTAVEASKALQGVSRNTVLLASAAAWSDALAATPLADALDTTVLYTYPDKLEAKTIAELKSLKAAGVSNVILLGGETVITPAVAAQLDDLGLSVDRIGGADRYETALLLAAEAVDHYEGKTRLADARASVESVLAKEATYQAAVAKWNAARVTTNAAYLDFQAKAAALDAANAALLAALDGIVAVPGAPTQEQLDALAGDLAAKRTVLGNTKTVQDFVAERLVDYAAAAGTNFQSDRWSDVVSFFGSESFSLLGKTGTLEYLSTNVPILAAAVSDDPTLQETGVNLTNAVAAQTAVVNTAAAAYGAAVKAAADAAIASAANAAQQQKIAAAQAVVVAAQKAYNDAIDAHNKAITVEAAAKAAAAAAAANRPTGDALSAAQKHLADTVTAVLKDGQRYPAFLATGLDFADALAAGPAAAKETGVVLLTAGTSLPSSTARYLASGANQVAVGGPAATAAPKPSVSYVGGDRYETATKLASAYFDKYNYVGLASGVVAADAVVGGALVANVDSTLVLTLPDTLPTPTSNFLAYGTDKANLVVFGGPNAISAPTVAAAKSAVEKKD